MKWNLLITVCIAQAFIKLYSQENVLNSTMLKQYVFVNAPKEWFKYIIKFLEIKISKRHINIREIYMFMNNKTLRIEDKAKRFKSSSIEKTIMLPLGWVRDYRESPSITKIHPPRRKTKNKRIFTLHEKLRLNLTFLHIHFGFRHLHTCTVGEVRVVSHSKNKQVFRYCGIYSNMILYPQDRNVSIFSPTTGYFEYSMTGIVNVTIFFSVIDAQRIVTLQRHILFSTNLLWNLYLVPEDIRVMKFALKSKKYQHFIITFTNDSELVIELYDGPGTHSPNIFKNNYETQVTSTFQSIIYLWIPSTKRLNTECGFQFVTESSNVRMNIQLNDSLPHIISHASTKYEVWKILSYYNVNLTIINLTYKGYNDPLCTIAGITVYSFNKDSYTEIKTECNFFYHPYSKYRDIYSKSNKTLIVLYSYKEYGNFSLAMQFSTTKCQPVKINTCALSYLCKFQNNAMCREHREQIKSLNLNYTQISTDFPISVNPGQCFIFQMVAVADRLSVPGLGHECKISFHHINILNRKFDIHFNIKAAIESKYIITFVFVNFEITTRLIRQGFLQKFVLSVAFSNA